VTQADVIDRAVEVIGAGRDDDYILAPDKQAAAFKDKAPALGRLLHTARIETYTQQYGRHDRAAGDAQTRFKTAIWRANGAVFATGVLGALIMVTTILGGPYWPDLMKPSLLVLGLIALITGAAASMWLFKVREGKLLDEWMGERAHAETARLAYFATLAQLQDSGPSELPLALLKLEYFRRYQLDMQITYYDQRRKDHRRSADRTLALGGFAAAIAAVASGSAGVLASSSPSWSALAALGVVGTALAAYAATREAVNGDRRNAERYGRTLASLEILRAKLDEVRAGVLAGSQAVLDEYVAAVHEQLSLEHREWLSGAESTRSAIGKLDETLAKLHEGEAGRS
jgi:hypothetical protein